MGGVGGLRGSFGVPGVALCRTRFSLGSSPCKKREGPEGSLHPQLCPPLSPGDPHPTSHPAPHPSQPPEQPPGSCIPLLTPPTPKPAAPPNPRTPSQPPRISPSPTSPPTPPRTCPEGGPGSQGVSQPPHSCPPIPLRPKSWGSCTGRGGFGDPSRGLGTSSISGPRDSHAGGLGRGGVSR